MYKLQDWEAVVEYLMQRGEAERALPVLRRPGVSQELWYKFAPTLMLLAPAQTVDAWMTAQPPLDPPRYACSLWPYFLLTFCQPPSPVPSDACPVTPAPPPCHALSPAWLRHCFPVSSTIPLLGQSCPPSLL